MLELGLQNNLSYLFFQSMIVRHCMICPHTLTIRIILVILTREWDIKGIRPPACQQAEGGGTQTCRMPSYHQRPTGPHRLWSSLRSILGMRMNTYRQAQLFQNKIDVKFVKRRGLCGRILSMAVCICCSLHNRDSSRTELQHTALWVSIRVC